MVTCPHALARPAIASCGLALLAASTSGCFNGKTSPAWYAEFFPVFTVDLRYDEDDGALHLLYVEGDGTLHHGTLGRESGERAIVDRTQVRIDGSPVQMFDPNSTSFLQDFSAVSRNAGVAPRPGSDEVWINLEGHVGRLDGNELVAVYDLVPQSGDPTVSNLVFIDESLLAADTTNAQGVILALDAAGTAEPYEDWYIDGACGLDVQDGLLYSDACPSGGGVLGVDLDLGEWRGSLSGEDGPWDGVFSAGFHAVPIAVTDGWGLYNPQSARSLCLLPTLETGELGWKQTAVADEEGCHGAATWWNVTPLARADVAPGGRAFATLPSGGLGFLTYDEKAPLGASGNFSGSWCAINSTATTRLDLPKGEAPTITSLNPGLESTTSPPSSWSSTKTSLSITYSAVQDGPSTYRFMATRVGDTLHVKVPSNEDDIDFHRAGYSSLTGTYVLCAEE